MSRCGEQTMYKSVILYEKYCSITMLYRRSTLAHSCWLFSDCEIRYAALEVQIKAVCIRLIPDQCLRLSVCLAPRVQLTADQRAEGAGRCDVTAGELWTRESLSRKKRVEFSLDPDQDAINEARRSSLFLTRAERWLISRVCAKQQRNADSKQVVWINH